jgi:ribosomal-protein-alanine N-acetyltransferase
VNSAQLQVREMRADDLDRVIALAASLDPAPGWPRDAYEAALDSGRRPERVALVADLGDGRIAGFVVGAVVAPEAEIESIGVAREFQRRGVARGLFEELVRRFRDLGVTEIRLEVRASNQAAQGYYRVLGFQENGRRPGYYSGPAEDAVLLLRELPEGRAGS